MRRGPFLGGLFWPFLRGPRRGPLTGALLRGPVDVWVSMPCVCRLLLYTYILPRPRAFCTGDKSFFYLPVKMWSGRPTKDDEAAHTGRTMSSLGGRDSGNLLESPPIQSEEERVTTPAEAILGGLENAAPSEVGVLLLN